MRAWQFDAFSIDRLGLVEVEDRPLASREIRVRVRAVSLNYRDLLIIQGAYDPKLPLPLIPCSDAAGEVVEVGREVQKWKVGDRVITAFSQKWVAGAPSYAKVRATLGGPLPGVLSEYAVVDEEGAWPCPSHLSFEEGATLPCAALTAWHALVDRGALKAGERVLIQGSGGVSIFALQIARLFGAEVYAITRTESKIDRFRAMGVKEVIHSVAEPEWGRTIRKITGNIGVEHVVEVGGAKTLAQSLQAVAFGGTIHVIGVLSGVVEPLNILPILMKEVRLSGVLVGPRESAEAMGRAFEVARIHPVIDRVYPFEQAKDAFLHLQSGSHFGKVVVAGLP
ncbi:MAG: NAD(P)-dependent alcohol dehydrogenase [Sandaracinaceae bacterium]|nr:NAD(P)-dependent alcohol dehydrogenase [Sandaracinaceae bacterium]MDW8247370.1 NAD(P)-dependent alcohol dehydrogenase [Sandaracinaceae bacterium]